MIFGHGDDAFSYGDKIRLDFSSNIYYAADLQPLRSHLAEHLGVIAHYPEPEARSLETMIARQLGVPSETILVTSGAIEAIYLIAQLYDGWTSIIPQPTFSEYEDACKLYHHLLSFETDERPGALSDDRVYWLCNPNNPTGNVINKQLLRYIIKRHPRYIYVVDQSYDQYTLQPTLTAQEMADCYNVILLRSLSKQYCIPGLRLGYIYSSPIIIDRLRQLRQPWTVNAVAIEAGRYLVEQNPRMIPDLKGYLEEANRLHRLLAGIKGLMVMDTATNFMCVNMDQAYTYELKQWLIKEHGILIRDASNFRGLDNHCFRVTARTPEDDDRLVEAITDFLKISS